ncbi:hypothetical protein RCM47_14500 [Escherichia coli]|nr:hypothetical protein [Escherichia coli]
MSDERLTITSHLFASIGKMLFSLSAFSHTTVLYLFSINAHGKPAGNIKLSRSQRLDWLVQKPKITVAMEACGASHYWAREIRKFAHDVILLPAQHVKDYQAVPEK